jgi:hypothetical protein
MFEEGSGRGVAAWPEGRNERGSAPVTPPSHEIDPLSGAGEELELAVGVGLAQAEAEVYAAESCIAMADSRVKMLAGTIARLHLLAVQVGLVRAEPIIPASPPPPIDDLTRAKARRALARSGFVRLHAARGSRRSGAA